jgi:hypothetical protein
MDSVNTRAATHPNRHRLEFEPVVVLPVQMQSSRMADASLVPEKLLMLAVLEEAITTFQRHVADTGRRGRRLFREAEEWLLSEEREWPCSVRNICDALGFDVSYLRGGLTRWRDERRRDPAGILPFRPRFRRLSGSRTRTVGRPIGLGRTVARRDEAPPHPPG